jgi:hypothetical protein
MGLLNWFSKDETAIPRLPSGSFTVDRHGKVMTGTVGSEFSPRLLSDVAHEVLHLFREARVAQIPLTGLNFDFASLRVSAREMHGGAIIFLSPHNIFETSMPPKKYS